MRHCSELIPKIWVTEEFVKSTEKYQYLSVRDQKLSKNDSLVQLEGFIKNTKITEEKFYSFSGCDLINFVTTLEKRTQRFTFGSTNSFSKDTNPAIDRLIQLNESGDLTDEEYIRLECVVRKNNTQTTYNLIENLKKDSLTIDWNKSDLELLLQSLREYGHIEGSCLLRNKDLLYERKELEQEVNLLLNKFLKNQISLDSLMYHFYDS